MHNITFVNKAKFVKLYNNFVLKWLIFALYVVVVPEQDTLRICDVSAMGLIDQGQVLRRLNGVIHWIVIISTVVYKYAQKAIKLQMWTSQLIRNLNGQF